MPGDFHRSSCNVRLDGTVLVATCSRSDGSKTESRLDLNSYVANNEGKLVWQRNGNFAQSSQNIQVTANGSLLVCTASQSNGQKIPAQLDLSERITNNEGALEVTF